MTTLDTITTDQIDALYSAAGTAGDADTCRDCELVTESFLGSDDPDLSTHADGERGDVRDALVRLVAVISDGEMTRVIANGTDMGHFDGSTDSEVLDAYARAAGYESFTDLLASVPGATREEIDLVRL